MFDNEKICRFINENYHFTPKHMSELTKFELFSENTNLISQTLHHFSGLEIFEQIKNDYIDGMG